MNLNQLRIFYLAAREGSQTAAADILCISQPAVTKALQRLQEEQGVQLLLLDGNRLFATYAGERLYELAEEIFELERKSDILMDSFRNEEHNSLSIDASLSFGDYYIPLLMNRYKQEMPNVHVSINVMPTGELIKRSVKMKNDIAFYSYEVKDPNLVVQPVVSEKLMIITRPEHKFSKMKYISPEDLNGETLISHEEGSIQKKIIDKMIEEYDLDIKILSVDYTSNEAIKGSIELGEGIALMSEKVVARAVRGGMLHAVPIGKKPLTRKLYMAWHRDRIITAKIQNLIDICGEVFGEL